MRRVSASREVLGAVLLMGVCTLTACGGTVSPAVADAGQDGSARQDSGSPGQDSGVPTVDSGPPGIDSGSGGTDSSVPIPDSGSSDTSVPDAATRVPLNHRPDDSQCLAPAPAGDCTGQPGPGAQCSQDSQCTTGSNGRCINQNSGGPLIGCRCTYDECTSDTSCALGDVCACHGSAYSDGAGNVCVPGNCRVDSDCGAHGYCSPTAAMGCGEATAGYYCHTPTDQCIDDSDCGGSLSTCAWSSSDSRWECRMVAVCA
jgi:hypothetical protein